MGNYKTTEKETITSISLDDNLYKAVKHLAVEEKKTFKDIVSESIKEYLLRRGIKLASE